MILINFIEGVSGVQGREFLVKYFYRIVTTNNSCSKYDVTIVHQQTSTSLLAAASEDRL